MEDLSPTTRLWIGNLDVHAKLDDLYHLLRLFGEINSITLLPLHRGGRKRSAFVNFVLVKDSALAFRFLKGNGMPRLTGIEPFNVAFKPSLVRISSQSNAISQSVKPEAEPV